ncbi:hypothetical protein ES702_06981 [subsurface metagenome]
MKKINNIKLKSLKQTQAFYIWELKKEDLTESERSKFLLALNSIEKIIQEKEKAGEKRKHKRFIAHDHKTVFQDNKNYRGY